MLVLTVNELTTQSMCSLPIDGTRKGLFNPCSGSLRKVRSKVKQLSFLFNLLRGRLPRSDSESKGAQICSAGLIWKYARPKPGAGCKSQPACCYRLPQHRPSRLSVSTYCHNLSCTGCLAVGDFGGGDLGGLEGFGGRMWLLNLG